MTPYTREEEAELRAAWEKIGAWEKTSETGEGEYLECPFCHGDGETEGFILDATNVTPATLVGCGIGDGLEAAELVAKSTGHLLATLDAERAQSEAFYSLFKKFDARAENLSTQLETVRRALDDALEQLRQEEHKRTTAEGAAKRVTVALAGILEIGKRDMTNQKYDAYFEEARAALGEKP